MSAPTKKPYWLTEGSGLWAGAWKVTAALAVVGLALSAFGYFTDAERFAYSYLFGFAVTLTLALGSLFFVVIQHVSGAHWGVTVRRVAEFFVVSIPLLAVLFVPVLLSKGVLYDEWTHASHGEGHARVEVTSVAQAQDHGHQPGNAVAEEESEIGHTPQQTELHHSTLAKKTFFLNEPFWYGRMALYFIVWIALALVYFRWSTTQDVTRDKRLTVKMQRLAPVAIVLFGLTLTFAAFDWFMSLEPTWYSTIYGVYVFSGAAIAAWAMVTLVSLSLAKHGHFGSAVNVEHFHDLGKLLFGFICFWAYIGFSQFMLIWYADIPEELTYFYRRWNDGGWATMTVLLMIGHFVFPFFLLISRVPKRRLSMLAFGCVWMLVMHVVDMYWFVMPYANDGRFSVHWMDLACLFGVVGAYLTAVFTVMGRYPLIPVGDPRLSRAEHFVQTH